MKKIALLGVENSHANSFISYIKEKPEYSDIEVYGVYSDEPEAVAKLVEKFGVTPMATYDEAVGKVDGVVITARHGDNHYKYAKPYIAAGIPMFIDKPITVSEEDAIAFMKDLRASGTRITGGSSVRHSKLVGELHKEVVENVNGETQFGFVKAPVQMNSVYGGFYFYSQHLVEAMLEIFGKNPVAVTTMRNGDNLTVTFEYPGFNTVGCFNEGGYAYNAARYTQKECTSGTLDAEGMSHWFEAEFLEYVDVLRGNSEGRDYADFIIPVFVLNAIMRSLESGKRETVNTFSFD